MAKCNSGPVIVVSAMLRCSNYPLLDILTAYRNVLAGGTFISASWSEDIFEIITSADVISREVNSIWRGAK